MLFCFKDLQWEKITVVITKTIYWNSERSVQFLKQNNFLTCSCTFEQLWFKLEKTLGFENLQEKLQKYIQSRVLSWNRLIKERLKTKVICNTSVLYSSLEILKLIYSEKATKFLRNLHQLFVLCTASQIILGDFAKFCGLLRIYQFYTATLNRLEQGTSREILR